MEEQRTNLTTILQGIIEPRVKFGSPSEGTHAHYLYFYSGRKVLFSVKPEDLFDKDGNRFEIDIE